MSSNELAPATSLGIACPKCSAPVGVNCRIEKPKGDRPYIVGGHQARYVALLEADRVAKLSPEELRRRARNRASIDLLLQERAEERARRRAA